MLYFNNCVSPVKSVIDVTNSAPFVNAEPGIVQNFLKTLKPPMAPIFSQDRRRLKNIKSKIKNKI